MLENRSVSDPVEVDRIQWRIWRRLGLFLLVGVVTGGVVGGALRISLGTSGTNIVSLVPQILPWLPGPFAVVLAIHVRMWGAGKDASDADDPEVRNHGHARVLYLEALLLGVGLGVLMLASALAALAILYQLEVVAAVQVLTAAVLLALLSADIGAEPIKDAQVRDEHRAESRLDRLARAASYWGAEQSTARPGAVATVRYLASVATVAWVLGAMAAGVRRLQGAALPSVEEVGLAWLWALCLAVLGSAAWYAVHAALVDRILGPALVIGLLSTAIWILVVAAPVVGAVTVSEQESMLTMLAVSASVLPLILARQKRAGGGDSGPSSVPVRYLGAYVGNLVRRAVAAREGTSPRDRSGRIRRWYDTISGACPEERARRP